MRLSKAEGKRMMQKLGMTEADLGDTVAGPSENKYGNEEAVVEGIKFDSKAEARRYKELRLLEEAGEIQKLSCQVRIPLYAYRLLSAPGEDLIEVAHYVADFCYWPAGADTKQGWPVIEDVKGAVTAVYALKKKWFEAQSGQKIIEIRYGRRR